MLKRQDGKAKNGCCLYNHGVYDGCLLYFAQEQ